LEGIMSEKTVGKRGFRNKIISGKDGRMEKRMLSSSCINLLQYTYVEMRDKFKNINVVLTVSTSI
jgi:hypothetical protein